MTPESVRLDLAAFQRLAPETSRALLAISAAVRQIGLGAELIELVKLRASVLNGCHFCIAMHTHEARERGLSEARIEAVRHWRDASVFQPRERAALAWTDALTRVADGDVPDEVYRDVSSAFSDSELAALTSAVVTINAWNRIAIAFRFPLSDATGVRR